MSFLEQKNPISVHLYLVIPSWLNGSNVICRYAVTVRLASVVGPSLFYRVLSLLRRNFKVDIYFTRTSTRICFYEQWRKNKLIGFQGAQRRDKVKKSSFQTNKWTLAYFGNWKSCSLRGLGGKNIWLIINRSQSWSVG